MRDWAVGVGPFDVDAQGGAVRGVADVALEAGVGLHFGVACLELVGEPLDGVRDADTEGAEALAIALGGTSSTGVPPRRSSKRSNEWVHHPRLGIRLKVAMDKLGIECHVQYKDGPPIEGYGGANDFLVKKLTGK